MKLSMRLLLLLCGILLLANGEEVSASWTPDAATCAGSAGTADERMAACTRAVTSGQLSTVELVMSYNNRGGNRFFKGDFSSAVSDLARSQQLKPDPYTAIWLYLVRTRSNGDGKAELASNTGALDGKTWPAPRGSPLSGQDRLRHCYLSGCRP